MYIFTIIDKIQKAIKKSRKSITHQLIALIVIGMVSQKQSTTPKPKTGTGTATEKNSKQRIRYKQVSTH